MTPTVAIDMPTGSRRISRPVETANSGGAAIMMSELATDGGSCRTAGTNP